MSNRIRDLARRIANDALIVLQAQLVAESYIDQRSV